MPVLTSLGFALFLDPVTGIRVPVAQMALQLAGMLIFPVALGMALRRWQRALVERHARGARRLSLVALAALIGFILLEEHQRLGAGGGSVVIAAVWFSLIALAAGWVVGRLAGVGAADRFTLLLEFAARNLAIAALVGIVVLERAELVLFATLFFLVQVPILLLLVGAFAARAKRGAEPPA
jgi:BASS family bile acid:Na+ symporter